MDKNAILKLATIARLTLPEAKITALLPQVNEIIGYASDIMALDTSNIPLFTQTKLKNVARDDVSVSSNIDLSKLKTKVVDGEHFFVVSRILNKN